MLSQVDFNFTRYNLLSLHKLTLICPIAKQNKTKQIIKQAPVGRSTRRNINHLKKVKTLWTVWHTVSEHSNNKDQSDVAV